MKTQQQELLEFEVLVRAHLGLPAIEAKEALNNGSEDSQIEDEPKKVIGPRLAAGLEFKAILDETRLKHIKELRPEKKRANRYFALS